MTDTARRISRGHEQEVPLSELAAGTLVAVKPGEQFPVDGVIAEGATSADEFSLTGEEREIKKYPSSRVYAGTRNVVGRVLVRTEAVGEGTLLARIAATRNAALQTSANAEQNASRAAVTAAIITVLAAIAAALLWRAYGTPLMLVAAATVLLAAAPHLFLAGTRRVYRRALSRLAKRGVIAASAAAIERSHNADVIVLDRTGVLTSGDVRAESIVAFKPYTQQQAVSLATSVELGSTHPVARAIVAFGKSHGSKGERVNDFREEGHGASGVIRGKRTSVGTAKLLEAHGFAIPPEAIAAKEHGYSVVYIIQEDHLIGFITLRDELREGVREVIRELKREQRTILITGEHSETAAAVGRAALVHEVLPEVPRSERHAAVRQLTEQGKHVAHVTIGDDVGADVTISVGLRRLGEIALLRPDIRLVGQLFREAHRAKRAVRKRLLLGSAYHAICLPFAVASPLILGVYAPVASAVVMGTASAIAYATTRTKKQA